MYILYSTVEWVWEVCGWVCTQDCSVHVYIVLYCRMSMKSMWVGMYTGLQYTLGRVLVLLYFGNPCSRHQSQEYHSFIYLYIHPILSFIHLFVLSFIHLASMRPSFFAFMHSSFHLSLYFHAFLTFHFSYYSFLFFLCYSAFINFLYYLLYKM